MTEGEARRVSDKDPLFGIYAAIGLKTDSPAMMEKGEHAYHWHLTGRQTQSCGRGNC